MFISQIVYNKNISKIYNIRGHKWAQGDPTYIQVKVNY